LLRGEKKAFKLADVKWFVLPLYPELGVKHLIGMAREDGEIPKYLRDNFWTGKAPS
jgi:hypothetical protein